jgi:MFS family permease
MLGMMFILTQYFQFAVGYTPLETGVRFAPMAIGFMLGAPSSAALVVKVGSKILMGTGLLITSGVILGLAFIAVTTPYWIIGVALLGLGIGMAWAMAPATDAVMAALPEEQAGVGSALNDTACQIGGALGVGIYGSIFNSVYSSSVADAVSALPSSVAAAARNSIGAAQFEADRLGGPAGEALRSAASSAFVDGLGVVYIVTAAVALVGSLVVFRFMPAHDVSLDPSTHGHVEGEHGASEELVPAPVQIES